MAQEPNFNGYEVRATATRDNEGRFIPLLTTARNGTQRQFPLDFLGFNHAHAAAFAEQQRLALAGVDETGTPYW